MFAARNKRVLIADEPGLGKTLQSIAAVVQSTGPGDSILVVAPKTAVLISWPAELRRWLVDVAPHDRIVTIGAGQEKIERLETTVEVLKFINDPGPHLGRQWVLLSPNYLRFKCAVDEDGHFIYEKGKKVPIPVREAIKPLLSVQWDAVIVDEAHLTLSGSTNDLKKQSAQSVGLTLLQTKPDALRIALSGTPFRGKHENLWGILHWLEPKKYRAYWKWTQQHFFQFVDPMSGTTVLSDIISEKALYEEVSDLMVRRTKGEVAKDLPPKFYGGTPHDPKKLPPPGLSPEQVAKWYYRENPIAVWLDMEPAQAKAYNEMVTSAMARIEGGTLMANGILAEMIRLKQFANSLGLLDEDLNFFPKLPSNKFNWIVQFLSERGIDGKGPGVSKVLIGSQFTRHIKLFEKELNNLKIPTFSLTGLTNDKDRTRMAEAFQSNSMAPFGLDGPAPDVFLLNMKAGGTAITLDAADDVVVLDRTFVHDEQEQFEDRAHRISRIHQVTVWDLISRGTIEEKALKAARKLNVSLKQVLDGERGVEFAVSLMMGEVK